jgi:hypothetical protein
MSCAVENDRGLPQVNAAAGGANKHRVSADVTKFVLSVAILDVVCLQQQRQQQQ